MGNNYPLAGFETVEKMVAAMSQSEDSQLAAMSTFLLNSHLNSSLQAHDWTSFARGYNGPNYVINRYDVCLNGQFQKYSNGVLPDLSVHAAQLYLTYLGFHPGQIDGIAGEETLAAYSEFARRQRLPATGIIDANAVTNLVAALPIIS
jgi:N-acetylmuramidase/Putative peptidoglycan binding domain